jgi:Flp pilus assembly protein TadG
VTVSKGAFTVRHFRRSGQDDGAAAVEFALLFPIFMILALGIISSGLAFSRQINVTQAAREASRYGATLPIEGGLPAGGTVDQRTDTWLSSVDNALCRSAGNGGACGKPGSENLIAGYDYRCVAIVVTDSAGAATDASRYREDGGTTKHGACPSTATAAIPNATFVQTVLLRKVQFFVLFINPTIHVDAVSVTPFEGNFK